MPYVVILLIIYIVLPKKVVRFLFYLYCMKKLRLITYYLILITCVSCQYDKTPKTFSTEKITIQYPSYLHVSNDVYPTKQTLLQTKNDYRDVYFILIDFGQKPSDSGFALMYDSITNQLKRNLKEVLVEKDSSFTINNLKAREYQVSGVLSSEKQAHRFLFTLDLFEDKTGHLYQTAGWLLRHKRQLWEKDLQAAAYSLTVK
jgi:hypothetical protein